MKRIQTFNEAFGVAVPTTWYLKRLTYMAIEELYSFVDRTRSQGKDVEVDDETQRQLSYKDIKPVIPTGDAAQRDWKSFPVSEINLTCELHKNAKITKSNGLPFPYLVGGYASSFARGREKYATRIANPIKENQDHTLSLHFCIRLYYGPVFRKISMTHPDFERTHLFKKVESVISHEMNHLFDQYKRRLHGAKGFEVGLTWASIEEDNLYDVPDNIFHYWQIFTDLIYNSEPHEVNAQTQEAQSYVSRMSFDKFRKLDYFTKAKMMQNWSSEEFINDFKEVIKEEGMDPEETLEKVRMTFIERYKDYVKNWNEFPDLDPWKLEKYSEQKFWKIFERKIKESGTTLIRNYCRLFAEKQYN
jgi:hypothetical protein